MHYSLSAQVRGENYFTKKWLIDINSPVGMVYQSPTINYKPNYPNPINSQFNNLTISPGLSSGIDLEVGCYFGKLKLLGIGTGIIYQSLYTQMSLDNFHIEYQANDVSGTVFRQVVSSTSQVNETLHATSINIPVVFKVKQLLTKKTGFSADAGILLNYSNQINYSGTGSFDYEAIYAYNVKANDNYSHYYDANPTPDATDWLITKQQFENHNVKTNLTEQLYFDSLYQRGYNVGLGLKPSHNSGTIQTPGVSLGFIVRPALNIKLYDRFYLYFGGYLAYQAFTFSQSASGFRLVDNLGSKYNSMLNAVSATNNLSLGANIGVRVFLGHSIIYIEEEQDESPEDKEWKK